MSTAKKKALRTSWTKFDTVQVIEIIAKRELNEYLNKVKPIDTAVLKSVLGINDLSDPLPDYWNDIYNYPKQVKLFALIATLFTHIDNIFRFANIYSDPNTRGIYSVEDGKTGTNIRRALINSGASLENYSRSKQVPYDFSGLFEQGEVGLLMQEVLKNRLLYLGYSQEELKDQDKFVKACIESKFHFALSLSRNNFTKWISGKRLLDEDVRNKYHKLKIYKEVAGLRINQWLNEWDEIDFHSPLRRKPEPYFIIVSVDARLLKRISDVHERRIDKKANTQRQRNNTRINEISNYIEGGFPWSTIPSSEQRLKENESLKMPGLLPTAIIANILGPGEERNGKAVNAADLVKVETSDNGAIKLVIPDLVFEDEWVPEVKPIEIIDGQHRLWAFDESEPLGGNYELPVIIFNNLDRAWQAYLFYTINVKPVKINTSLGYDLYPLLRTQEWLEKSKDGLLAYRETRAQEIVGALWEYPDSPWYQRINMLGESNGLTISQAAFIKALSGSFFKRSKGLFGSELITLDGSYRVLDWNRPQQVGFIVLIWQSIAERLQASEPKWAVQLRNQDGQMSLYTDVKYNDLALISKNSFLARDQGIRAITSVANDFFFLAASFGKLDFNKFHWNYYLDASELSISEIDKAVEIFREDRDFVKLVDDFSECIIDVDWRTISAPFDDEQEKEIQKKYKGSGGYREFREAIVKRLKISSKQVIQEYSRQLE